MVKHIHNLEVNGYIINNIIIDRFCAYKDGISITFQAELVGVDDGLYSHIIYVYDSFNKRGYSASRYHRKYIAIVRELAWQLELHNALWNYKYNRPCARTDITYIS